MNPYFIPDSLHQALEFTSKSGYLRKSVFFNYLSQSSRSTKFRNWKQVLDSGYLASYERKFIGEDVYKLSYKGKRLLSQMGKEFVSACHPLHFEHDDIAIEFALANQIKNQILPNWKLEKVLRQNQNTSFGTHKYTIEKLPDLLFQIPVGQEKLNCALEIERTRKSPERYRSFIYAYSKASQIDLVLVAYSQDSIRNHLMNQIQILCYPTHLRPIGFCRLEDLINTPTDFSFILNGNQISFCRYIKKLESLVNTPPHKAQDFESASESQV